MGEVAPLIADVAESRTPTMPAYEAALAAQLPRGRRCCGGTRSDRSSGRSVVPISRGRGLVRLHVELCTSFDRAGTYRPCRNLFRTPRAVPRPGPAQRLHSVRAHRYLPGWSRHGLRPLRRRGGRCTSWKPKLNSTSAAECASSRGTDQDAMGSDAASPVGALVTSSVRRAVLALEAQEVRACGAAATPESSGTCVGRGFRRSAERLAAGNSDRRDGGTCAAGCALPVHRPPRLPLRFFGEI